MSFPETEVGEYWNLTATPNDGYEDGNTVWSNTVEILPTVLNLVWDANGNLLTGDGYFRVDNSLNQLARVYFGLDQRNV